MPPSSPACRSSRAQAVIRSSAASTSSGGSSRPISAALPESSAHRSTRANFAAVSRRSFAFSGATSITARAIAARSPPGVSRPARSRTSGLGGAGLGVIEQGGGAGDDLGLVPGDRPVVAARPWCRAGGFRGSGPGRSGAGAAAGLPQRVRDLVRGELRVLGGGVAAGQLGDGGELAGARRGPRPGPTRTPPRSARPRTPRRTGRPRRPRRRRRAPGSRSRAARPAASPARTRPPGWTTRPGKTRAEPGWPGPRRPVVAASTASSSSAAASRISASSSAVNGSKPPYSSSSSR